LFICLNCVGLQVFAAPNDVQIQCVSINEDNTTSLTWSESDLDNANFLAYDIYVKNNPSAAYVILTSISLKSQTTFVHTNSNVSNNRVFYFVRVSSNAAVDNVSASSDTVATIFLEVQNPTKIGVAKLFWNGSKLESTEIQKMYPDASWSLLKNTVAGKTNYNDTVINICQAELGYRVSQTIGGCVSYSNQVFDDFVNWQPPTTPTVNIVTVDQSNKWAQISWEKPPEIDTEGYLIYYYRGDTLGVDSVKDANQLIYNHQTSGVYDSSVTYQVLAYDNCKHIFSQGKYLANSSTPLNINHRSVYLKAEFVNCSDEINLIWNSYISWAPVVSDYCLMIKNMTTNTIDSVHFTGGQSTYNYTLSGLPLGDDYSIWIKATNGTHISLSNDHNFLLQEVVNPSQPLFVGIDARNENNWTIQGFVDVRNDANKAILQRLGNGWVTTHRLDNLIDNDLMFSYTKTVKDSVITFRFGVINACETDTIFSAPFQNIWLSGEAIEDKVENLMIWNSHEFWSAMPQEYQIYRQDLISEQFLFEVSLVNTRTSYIDNVLDETGIPGTFCYYIEAIESQNGANFQGQSFSNVLCVNQPHQLYVPNAFSVHGYNPIFKPKGVFLALDNYEFTIVDRWGNTMFFAQNINEGWDGRVNGKIAPQGIYVYSIGFQDAKGQYYFKTGTVTLLK
jgi:gliding motility-associated-like protein